MNIKQTRQRYTPAPVGGRSIQFNNVKGFGFIISQDYEVELFALYSTIMVDGYKSLKAGQQVEFDTSPADRGIHGINIKPIE